MSSDDEYFLGSSGIVIKNDRNQQDYTYVYDTRFSGME